MSDIRPYNVFVVRLIRLKLALYRQFGLQEAEEHENGKVSPTHRPPLPSSRYSWYSFLSEADLVPGP